MSVFRRRSTLDVDVEALADALGGRATRRRQRRDPISYRVASWLGSRLATISREHLLPRIPVAVRVVLGSAVALPVAAAIAHRNWPASWPIVLPAGAIASYGAWWRLRPAGRVNLPGRRGVRVRWLPPLALGATAIWLAVAWSTGLQPVLMDVLLVGAGIALLITILRRPRAPKARPGRDPAEIVASWPVLTSSGPLSKTLSGSTASVWSQDDVGWTLQLQLVPGHTVDQVVAMAANLESAIRVPRGSLRVLHDEQADRCYLRVVTHDQLRATLSWPGPKAESVLEAIPLGPFEDGETARLPLVPRAGWGCSALIAGKPGAGKSSLLNAILAWLAHCRDVVLMGIDPQGTELGPWEQVFEPGFLALGDVTADTKRLLVQLQGIMAARTRWMRQQGVRAWSPSPETPEIVLVADEFADLAEHMERFVHLARAGRKAGIHLIMATQRPSARALGEWGTELRAMVGASICLRVQSTTEVNIALGPGAASEGWRADQILKQPGEFLISSADPAHASPRRGRAYLVEDVDVQRWASACASRRPRLDQLSAAAAAEADG